MPRFETEGIGRYAAEFDREDQSLLLGWPGSQTFFSLIEAMSLRDYLIRGLGDVRQPAHQGGKNSHGTNAISFLEMFEVE